MNPNFTIDDVVINPGIQSFNPNTGVVETINMQDILGGMQEKWMFAIIITSSFLLIYVLYNNFVRNPAPRVTLSYMYKKYGVKPIIEPKRRFLNDSLDSCMDEWALIPIVYLVIVSITYYTGFKGI